MTTVDFILDLLLAEGAIIKENYDKVRSKTINQEKMRELYNLLKTRKAKHLFYKGLEEHEKLLLGEL